MRGRAAFHLGLKKLLVDLPAERVSLCFAEAMANSVPGVGSCVVVDTATVLGLADVSVVLSGSLAQNHAVCESRVADRTRHTLRGEVCEFAGNLNRRLLYFDHFLGHNASP